MTRDREKSHYWQEVSISKHSICTHEIFEKGSFEI